MEHYPQISIIVPAYNAERTIKDTIYSILEQSYKNFELIIINDGSTDATLDICKQFDDQRIRIFSQENAGLSNTRNIGIEKANGKYICFVDSDDTVNNQYLEHLYNSITKNDTDLAICGIILERNDNKKYSSFEKSKIFDNCYSDKDFMQLFENGLINSSCNKLYKTNIIKYNNLKFLYLNTAEDIIFNVEYLKYTSKVSTIKEALYTYKLDNSHLTKKVSEEMFVANTLLHKNMLEYTPIENHIYINTFLYHQYLSLIIKFLYKINANVYDRNNTYKILDKYINNQYIRKSFNAYTPSNYKEQIIHFLVKNKLYTFIRLYLKIKDR